MSDCGTTTVLPGANALGWLTAGVSVIRTTSEPCATAAGVTWTLLPITTVPVREFTITRAGGLSGLHFEVLDMRDIADALRLIYRCAHANRDRIDRLGDVPAPKESLIASAIRYAVVKSGELRFRISESGVPSVDGTMLLHRRTVWHAARARHVDRDSRAVVALDAEAADVKIALRRARKSRRRHRAAAS